MTGWFLAIGLAAFVGLAMLILGRLPRTTWEPLGAALLLGVAGYVWQGTPGLAGSPRAARTHDAQVAAYDEKIIERRQSLSPSFGKPNQWLILSDGLARQGKTGESANTLVSGLRHFPQDAALWLALGNALVAHGDGFLSPSADYAFRRAMALAPEAPAEPYFYGLALAQSGQLEAARDQWAPLARRLPPESKLRAEIEGDLDLIDRVLAAGDSPAS